MKKICVFSDSHGYADNMIAAIRTERPDLVIHLGDGEGDLYRVQRLFPDLPVENVRGNCDGFSAAALTLRTTAAGKRIFATHGHAYNVKFDRDLQKLRYSALEDGADIVLFGHTHRPYTDEDLGMKLMNPGTVGDVPHPTYGVVTIGNDGTVGMVIREAVKSRD